MMNFLLEIRNFADSSELEVVTAPSGKLVELSRENEINGVQQIEFVVAYNLVTPANFALGNIVRCVDFNDTNDPYTTYRIKKKSQYRSGAKTYISILAEHLKYDLQDTIISEKRTFYGQSVNEILDWILDFDDTGWSRGTVTNGTSELEEYEVTIGTTIYDAIRGLGDEAVLECFYHADGTDLGAGSDYQEVDLIIVSNSTNGTPGTAAFVLGTNLNSVDYEVDVRDNFATRIHAVGGGANPGARTIGLDQRVHMTVEAAEFTIKSYSSGWVTFYSNSILIEDDALNGYEFYCWGPTGLMSGLPTAILDSEKTSGGDRIQVSGGAFSSSPAEGDIGVFYDGVNQLSFIPNAVQEGLTWPISKTFQETKYDDYKNFLGPYGRADMSKFSAGLCLGWGKIGSPTTTEDTTSTYIVNGTSSQKVVAGDSEGIYKEFDLELGTDAESTVSFYVWLTVTSLAADTYVDIRLLSHNEEVEGVPTDIYVPTEGIIYEKDNQVYRGLDFTASAPTRIICEGFTVKNDGSTTQRLEILSVGGAATFYVDSVLLVSKETILGYDNFTAGDTRARLWESAVRDYIENNALEQKYSCEVLDRYYLNRTTYSADEFEAGDSATLTDAGVGINGTVRVVRKKQNLSNIERGCDIDIELVNKGDARKIKRLHKDTDRLSLSASSLKRILEAKSNISAIGSGGILIEDDSGVTIYSGRQLSAKMINGERRVKQVDGSYQRVYNRW